MHRMWYISLYLQKVELIPGYGICIIKQQLDEANADSHSSPTRLIQNLLAVYFSRDILAKSSAYGNCQNLLLDRDILAACIRKLVR